jgi:hypothetical protein
VALNGSAFPFSMKSIFVSTIGCPDLAYFVWPPCCQSNIPLGKILGMVTRRLPPPAMAA